jgi:hypothetical protein
MEPFLLGLSNGAVCVAYCAPVLVPCLLGEGGGVSRSGGLLACFLGGRLLGYLLFGIMAWAVGRPLLKAVGHRELIVGFAYVLLSMLLVRYGFFSERRSCRASRVTVRLQAGGRVSPSLLPVAAGLATGLNFCPPFLLALAGTAGQGTLVHTFYFFLSFFLGTSVFFLPAPFIGLLRPFPVLKTVGKMAAGVMGVYYFYTGLIMMAGGFKSL